MGREAVEREFFVDPDIGKAETLPAYAFDDPDVLALELKTIFSRAWLLVPEEASPKDGSVGSAEFLNAPGARLPFSILGRRLFCNEANAGD